MWNTKQEKFVWAYRLRVIQTKFDLSLISVIRGTRSVTRNHFTNRSSTNGKLLARASPSGMRHVLQEMTVKLLSLLAIGFFLSS